MEEFIKLIEELEKKDHEIHMILYNHIAEQMLAAGEMAKQVEDCEPWEEDRIKKTMEYTFASCLFLQNWERKLNGLIAKMNETEADMQKGAMALGQVNENLNKHLNQLVVMIKLRYKKNVQ